MKSLIACAVIVSFAVSDGQYRAGSTVDAPRTNSDSTAPNIREQFNVLAQKWLLAYNSNDSATLASMYTVDAQYISSHVRGLVAQGRGRLISNFQNGIKTGGHIDSVTILSVQLSCDLATLLCKYEATNNGQKAIGRNLLVLKKVGPRWLIVLHMTVV